ncbi:MAG: GNAT family N-acetyltransferase [Betaproteobacteria bacterium]|nr:GNAT family N-acetyltransferase [Betaproteobacteria bacterium]
MTAHAITVRLAGQRDAQAIALMSRDLVESGLGWKYDAARVLKAIRDPDTLTPVACDGGRIAGFGIMEFGDERAHLVLLAVRPTHRRMGIGRRLVDWLVESSRTAGIASLHLELRAANEAARGFYRAMAFDETIVVPGYYRGREAALRMIRVLRAAGPVPYTWRPSTT